jgi:RNA polymerase sigma-70 factor (ECF subfamily)
MPMRSAAESELDKSRHQIAAGGGKKIPARSDVPPSAGSPPRLRRRTQPLRHDEDRHLIARVIAAGKRGDREAIRFLYDRYADDVYGYVYSIMRDAHEAEDVTQNVFIKLMRVLPKYEERAAPFCAWLLRVARNVAMDHLRSQRMIPCEQVHDPDREACDEHMDRVLSLHDAMSALLPDHRRVVLWRHLAGFSPVEIAEHLGRTEGAVHALHHRGRLAMQSELAAMGAAPSSRPEAEELALAS